MFCRSFNLVSNFIVLIHNFERGFIVHHAKSKNSPSRRRGSPLKEVALGKEDNVSLSAKGSLPEGVVTAGD